MLKNHYIMHGQQNVEHVEESITETDEGQNVCILLVILTHTYTHTHTHMNHDVRFRECKVRR